MTVMDGLPVAVALPGPLFRRFDNLISSCYQARQLDNVYLDAHVHVSACKSVTSRSLGRRVRADKFHMPLSAADTTRYRSTNTNFNSDYPRWST